MVVRGIDLGTVGQQEIRHALPGLSCGPHIVPAAARRVSHMQESFAACVSVRDQTGVTLKQGIDHLQLAVFEDHWDGAAKLWQASASQGYGKGEFSLGRAYQYGIGVPIDHQIAIAWV